MKKSDVKIGKTYYMNHTSGRGIKVRILREKPTRMYGSRDGSNKLMTHWYAENLATGRQIEIKSATKLLSEVVTPEEVALRRIEASDLGRKAFEAGITKASQDARLVELVVGIDRQSGLEVLGAWKAAWQAAKAVAHAS